jgi:N-acetylglucosaminyl-diphospho-decaprenol L-rhamnosyltransferase
VRISVVVIDNGSSDKTPEFVRSVWPGIIVIELQENTGYGAAVNEGARAVAGADVLAVNDDAVLTSDCLEKLARVLDQEPRVAVVAPRLVYPGGIAQPSAHRFPTLMRLLWEALMLDRTGIGPRTLDMHHRDYAYDRRLAVDWATGAVLLVRREAWEAVGGFDTAYVFFVEEIDLQRRLAAAGWKTIVEPAALAVHAGAKRPIPVSRFLQSHDGMERYFLLYSTGAAAVAARLILCLTALTRAVAWGVKAITDSSHRTDARAWATMFIGVFVRSIAAVRVRPARRLASRGLHRPAGTGR